MGYYWRALTARAAVVVPVCLVVTGLGSVGPASAASGDPSGQDGVALALDRYSDLLVDAESGRVLVSDGSSVLVTDLAGTPVGRPAGLAGVSDLVQDPATGTVYAAVTHGASIAAIDPASLDVTVLSTGAGSCPDELAVDQGIVWAHDSCSQGFWSLDPADGSVVPVPELIINEVELATGPALPGRLFVGHPGSDSQIFAYDTAGRTLTEVATHTGADYAPHDVAVSPDGTRLLWAHGFLRTSDLRAVAPYWYRPPSGGASGAMAYRADGAIVTGLNGWVSGLDAEMQTRYDVAPVVGNVVHAGVAWVGTTAYAIAKKEGVFRLFARKLGTVTTTRLRADSLWNYRYGDRAELTVKLLDADAGDVVRVFARPLGGSRTLIAEGPVDADGVFVTHYRMVRETTFTAQFAGDREDEQNASKSEAITRGVRQEIAGTAKRYAHLDGSVAVFRPGTRAWFAFRVRPAYPRNCTVTTVQAKLNGRWRTVAGTHCARVPSGGRFMVYLDYLPVLRGRQLRLEAGLYPAYGSAGVASTGWLMFRYGR